MGNIKQINIKNCTYYFFNEIINIKNFDSSLIKIEKRKRKNYYYKNIDSVNTLYLVISKADGYIEENNGTNYLMFTSADGNKKLLAKFTKLWYETKHL